MKRMISLLLAVLSVLLLASCSFGTTSLPDGTVKLASYSGDSPLPLRAAKSGELWYMILGHFGESGGALAVGTDPESPEAVYEVPEESTVASFAVEGMLAVWTEQSESALKLLVYSHESGTVTVLDELKRDQCPQIALIEGAIYCTDVENGMLMRYDASGSAQTVFPIAEGIVQAVKNNGESLAWVIATEQGRMLFVYRPDRDKAPMVYTLPSHVSVVYGFDFLPQTGIALAYADAVTYADSVGVWYPNEEEVIPYFNFSEQIRFDGTDITVADGKIHWITAAMLAGRELAHYRIVAMDLATREPTEYMRAFSFSFHENELIYLGFDSNNRTDRISLYQNNGTQEAATT